LHDGLQKGRTETSEQVKTALFDSARTLSERIEKLTDATESKLKEISGQVDKRLNEGFEKTSNTFTDIVKRLALIDQAQQKISELSGNVVSLKDLLADKRSRGAFGEIQLSALIRNVLPESAFSLQATLSNGNRADCLLYMPEPTGNIVIDAKFPLENFQRLMDNTLGEADKRAAEQQFRQDIKKHIKDISEKYIVPGETSDGAIMFIPAEAIFAEIHAHYPDLVEASYKAKVWLSSPTTMMAILTTVRAVLKDDATKKQVHIIQKHLQALSKDFERFQSRMDALQKHIEQANKDVADVNISAKKITTRFGQIEQVEINSSLGQIEQILDGSEFLELSDKD
jgi:DNA recombination protein RmuC